MNTRRPVLVAVLALTLAACVVPRTGTPRPAPTVTGVAADGTDVTFVPGCPITFYLDPPGVAPDPCSPDEQRPAPTPEPGELVVHLVLEDGRPVLRMASG